MREDCWYKNVCTTECTKSCIRYMEMDMLVRQSCMPRNRSYPDSLYPDDCDYDAFCTLSDIKSDMVNFVEHGHNLYIYSSTTGNGKTSWAIKLMMKYFDSIWSGNGFRRRGIFVHVPTFLNQLKNFNNQSIEFLEMRDALPYVDLVIWDDIASTDMSGYDNSQLLSFIDQRTLSEKSNIYTGNIDNPAISKALGIRLASRVWNNSMRVELKGGDKR